MENSGKCVTGAENSGKSVTGAENSVKCVTGVKNSRKYITSAENLGKCVTGTENSGKCFTGAENLQKLLQVLRQKLEFLCRRLASYLLSLLVKMKLFELLLETSDPSNLGSTLAEKKIKKNVRGGRKHMKLMMSSTNVF